MDRSLVQKTTLRMLGPCARDGHTPRLASSDGCLRLDSGNLRLLANRYPLC
jgi:hypothetical protein